MSYKVLSRKYRPKIFSEVVGQENALTILRSFIQTQAIPHALIFSGSRGIGKTSLARIFAKTINCSELRENKDCSDCSTCKDIDENKSLDVIEIDAASNNGVDQIREVIESSNYSSINCQYKVFIIDEVHMLSKAAFNALLKTLEEPNTNTIFILATTEVEKIPLTILSRCQAINFKTLEKKTLIENLENVCKKENITIDTESLSLVAEESRGSARDSLGILEQLMTSLDKNISINEARKILGATSNQILFQISENLLMSNTKECLKNYAHINKNGYDSKKFIHSLLNYFRSAIYYKLGIQNEIEDIITIQESEAAELNKYNLELFENLFDELIKLYELCSKTQNVKFLIESNLIKLCLISNYLNFDEIIGDERIEKEIALSEVKPNNTEEKPLKESKNSGQKKSQKIKTSEFSASNFLDNLKEIEDENFKLLSGCSFKVEKSNITISTKSGLIYEILKEKEKIITIEELIKDFFNSKHKIKIVKIEEVNDSVDSEDFKFAEKKDKLFESETMKNLFSAFDCRVLNIEKDK
ncbi:DNA polymerase III subunit gamma/tau [bacterium]|jgi:DNA polymerase-3 subunit gamma/tau|nr:DNA polymerase III subunit gamma/tau [bacterium]MBT3795129.1 DNA polymerase III subunit gamma/tau [bacterium]